MARYLEPQPGEMLKYLPAIYREADGEFLQNFLAAFEKILLGRADPQNIPTAANLLHHKDGKSLPQQSLEGTIANIAELFDPEETRDEFLPWLADWAALSLRRDLPPQNQRKFLMDIFRLYSRRGTKENLEKLLTIFTVGVPTITEDDSKPHQFKVKLVLSTETDPQEIERQIAIAYELIELEKPAHTSYVLDAEHVSMQIGVRSTVGKDTLLGVIEKNPNS